MPCARAWPWPGVACARRRGASAVVRHAGRAIGHGLMTADRPDDVCCRVRVVLALWYIRSTKRLRRRRRYRMQARAARSRRFGSVRFGVQAFTSGVKPNRSGNCILQRKIFPRSRFGTTARVNTVYARATPTTTARITRGRGGGQMRDGRTLSRTYRTDARRNCERAPRARS